MILKQLCFEAHFFGLYQHWSGAFIKYLPNSDKKAAENRFSWIFYCESHHTIDNLILRSKSIKTLYINYLSGVRDYLSGVRFKSYYYIYNQNLIPKQTETSIREIVKSKGGIRVYRNGFRVLPYGEIGNDWLGLDASVRKRTILPVHGNNNFITCAL